MSVVPLLILVCNLGMFFCEDNITGWTDKANDGKASNYMLNGTHSEIESILLGANATTADEAYEDASPPPCPVEKVVSIGKYEVPNQLQMLQMTAQMITYKMNEYQEKQMLFLKNINEAMKAGLELEKSCINNRKRMDLRQCIKKLVSYSKTETKQSISKYETQRIHFFTSLQNGACSLSDLESDPLTLVNSLAMDLVSTEYALPGFLKLLKTCTTKCQKEPLLEKIVAQMNRSNKTSNQAILMQNILRQNTIKQHARVV